MVIQQIKQGRREGSLRLRQCLMKTKTLPTCARWQQMGIDESLWSDSSRVLPFQASVEGLLLSPLASYKAPSCLLSFPAFT